jgi:transposase-like protein
VSQHFLLTPAARSLSLAQVLRLSDEEAHNTFKRIRFAANNGAPFCPHCGCIKVYTLAETPIRWKCSGCRRKFSVTSGTIFHSRKLAIRDYLAVIALFCNGVKGVAALRMARDMNINPKSAFVLLHKLREAVGGTIGTDELTGTVEIDGAYFGQGPKLANRKTDPTAARSKFSARSLSSRASGAVAKLGPGLSPRKPMPCRWSSKPSRAAQKFMPTNQARGTSCTPVTRCAASITRSSSSPQTAAARTKPNRSSRGSAGPNLASTIGSAAICCKPTRTKWRGVKTTAGSRTARNGSGSSAPR